MSGPLVYRDAEPAAATYIKRRPSSERDSLIHSLEGFEISLEVLEVEGRSRGLEDKRIG